MSRIDERVCVIGNSYIGAVYRAYKDRTLVGAKHYSFFAAPGYHFERLGFDGSTLTRPPYGDFDDLDMRSYGFFVLYADAASPADCITYEREIAGHYSTQVSRASIKALVRQCFSIKLASYLIKIAGRPVFVLSRNSNVLEDSGSEEERIAGAAHIASAARPAQYIPFPPEMFEGRRARTEYYKGSLNMMGREPDRAAQPDHHLFHMNGAGGALILREIEGTIGQWEREFRGLSPQSLAPTAKESRPAEAERATEVWPRLFESAL